MVSPIRRKRQERLSFEQKVELKTIVLEQSPMDYGYDRYIWTGALIRDLIEKKWGVKFKKTRVYEILNQLGLSYQRAHRDYANADTDKQRAYIEKVKKNK